MKANDICIGDWVKFPHGIDKIVDLPYIVGRGNCASFAASATLFPIELDKLEPIPLTPEILEKNGWFYNYKFDLHIPNEDGIVLQSDYSDKHAYWWYVGDSVIAPMDYVHELQHALRLCGIDKEIVL